MTHKRERLFFTTPRLIQGNRARIEGKEARHMYTVLRMRQGMACSVCDGTGTVYDVVIGEQCSSSCVEANILSSQRMPQPSVRISIAQAIPQRGKFELIVEKATELGVADIIPLYTKHTMVSLPDRKVSAVCARWQEGAHQAAKQAHVYFIPRVHEPVTIERIYTTFSQYDLVLFPTPYEKMHAQDMMQRVAERKKVKPELTVLMLIGPEGGFTDEESRKARENGALLFSLGSTILKTDTALISCLSLVLYGV